MFTISKIIEQPDNSLITLRMKLTKGVIENIILACGGSFDLSKNNGKEALKINITNKNVSNNGSNINVIIGPVLSETENLTLDLYRRYMFS